MDGRSAFVLAQAVSLIASGGQYANRELTEVIGEVLGEIGGLDHYFTCPHDDEPEGGTRH